MIENEYRMIWTDSGFLALSSQCKNSLYGLFVLRNRVSAGDFIQFFNLSLAIRILLDDKGIDVAQKLIDNFRAKMTDSYAEHSQAEFLENISEANH